jgi:hypothetical protein
VHDALDVAALRRDLTTLGIDSVALRGRGPARLNCCARTSADACTRRIGRC